MCVRYEREEAFIALNLTVKNATLQDSLDQFVKGELLDGDNAYFCEKCGEKVSSAVKKSAAKYDPPPHLPHANFLFLRHSLCDECVRVFWMPGM